jgi:hypothetical protein
LLCGDGAPLFLKRSHEPSDAISMKSGIELLLDNLCVELGFCLPPNEYARLASCPPTSTEAFTNAVFVAERLDPLSAKKELWRAVHSRVTKCFEAMDSDDELDQSAHPKTEAE